VTTAGEPELPAAASPTGEQPGTERSDFELPGIDAEPLDGLVDSVEPDEPIDPEAAGRPDQVGALARLEIRGPFLLLFALAQQQSSLLHHAMADRPLQPAEFAVYSALRLSQPTTPTQLAATLGMKATTLSSMLVRMAKNGHLKRRRNPADGRSVVLSLSPAGVRATDESFTSFSVAIESFRRHLEIEEPALLHSLEAMSRALNRAMVELSSGESQPSARAGS
jgi:DNA-binding MarR family transcriptional regulator